MSEHNTQPSPRIIRMEQELAELQERCNKIRLFTRSESWAKVNKISQELLGAQYSAMQTYARILNIRLKIAYGEDARAGRPAKPQPSRPSTVSRTAQQQTGGIRKRK